MVDENPNKEEELNSGDYPLSPADWAMFLSGGISDRRMRFLTFATMNIGGMFVVLGGTIALIISGTIKSAIASYVLLIFAGLLLTSLFQDRYRTNQKIKDIEEIRDDIIYKKLKNHKIY